MKRSICTFALASLLATSPAAFAAGPHGGGGGMAGGMGGAMHPMAAPTTTHGLTPTTPTPSTVRGPTQTGQPKQSCQAGANYPANTPGNSFSAPGSAFNPNGNAGTHYAGTQPQNSGNTASVSQYDVACSH